MKRYITVMTAALFVSATAHAAQPSFSCYAARLPAEILICTNEELARLDVQNAGIYYAARDRLVGTARKMFNTMGREWLARRNACGFNADCVTSAYYENMARMCAFVNYAAEACDYIEGE